MNPIAPHRWTLLVMHADPLLRAGLVAALRPHAAFETFVDGAEGDLSHPSRIDVVITDYDSAMRLAGSVRCAHDALAGARVMILTSNDREVDIRRAIEAGIHGYMLAHGPLAELIEGATTVANGMRYVSRCVAQRMADSLTRTSLTTRELEVLRLVAAGESNKAIARQLRIESGTVKSHMTSIMNKLDATCRTQAAGIAATRGLVEPRAALRPVSPRAETGWGMVGAAAQHAHTQPRPRCRTEPSRA